MITGCTGDDEAPAPWPTLSPPTSSGTSTPDLTPTLAPTPPVRPKSAYPSTEAGAQEFVRWYLQAVVYAARYNDATPILDVALPGCKQCRSIVDSVEAQEKAGHHLEGQVLTPTTFSTMPGASPERTVLSVTYDETASRLTDATGKTVKNFGSGKNRQLVIALKWEIVAGWHVIGGQFKEYIGAPS